MPAAATSPELREDWTPKHEKQEKNTVVIVTAAKKGVKDLRRLMGGLEQKPDGEGTQSDGS